MKSKFLNFKVDICDYENSTAGCNEKPAIVDYIKDISVETWAVYSKMNFTERRFEPSFRVYDLFHSTVINTDQNAPLARNYMYLRRNTATTEDNLIYPFFYDFNEKWYDVGKQIERPLTKYNSDTKLSLAKTIITQSREEVANSRAVYNFLDLLGDLGGLTECFMITFGFFLLPISEHDFVVQATKRLFIAKTTDDDLLMEPNF